MRQESGDFVIDNGIGVATGPVISGTIGSQSGRKIFTVTGEATENAAKLEALTTETKSKIILCPMSYKICKKRFEFKKCSQNSYELVKKSYE